MNVRNKKLRPFKEDSVVFLFRDDFTTAEAAPLTSPRTAEPGPGTGTIVDTGNLASIASGRIVFNGSTAQGDPTYADISHTRTAGLLLYAITNIAHTAYLGWDVAAASYPSDSAMRIFPSNIQVFDNATALVLDSITRPADYKVAVLLRDAGMFIAMNGNEFSEWTLVWVGVTSTATPLYPQATGRTGIAKYDNLRVSQLPTPWDTDNGIATEVLAGARTAGDTFTHEADCLIESTITTVPSAGQIELRFRIADATPASEDLWQVTIDSTGALDLDEVVAGTPTQRGTAAGVIANGDRIVIVCDDETIQVYEATTLRITYSSAASSKTATAGELETEGTGGSVSDIIAWPRTLSGAAKAALDAVANA